MKMISDDIKAWIIANLESIAFILFFIFPIVTNWSHKPLESELNLVDLLNSHITVLFLIIVAILAFACVIGLWSYNHYDLVVSKRYFYNRSRAGVFGDKLFYSLRRAFWALCVGMGIAFDLFLIYYY